MDEATGISLGGMTTTMAAFHPNKRDPRIKAAASIARPLSMLGSVFFAGHNIPFLMLAADEDALVDYQANARSVLERVNGAQLVTVTGASHTGFSDIAKYMCWLDNPDSVGCKQVLKNINLTEGEPWLDLLGSPEQRIINDSYTSMTSFLYITERGEIIELENVGITPQENRGNGLAEFKTGGQDGYRRIVFVRGKSQGI